MTLKACIFDLDGVIVDTAKYHFLSWKVLAGEMKISFTEKDNEQLKGLSRMASLNKIIALGNKDYSEENKNLLAAKKNKIYMDYVQHINPSEILPGVATFLNELKQRNIKIALGSASKNARMILEKIALLSCFDAVIDGNGITEGKPNPEVFLKAAAALNVSPSEAVVFEDASAGVEAALAGGFHCIGIGNKVQLNKAGWVVDSLENMTVKKIMEKIKK